MHPGFYDRVAELVKAGATIAIAHLVAQRGSTPNDVGSKMIVFPDGTSEFTIGGGPFEAAVIKDAVAALAARRSTLNSYTITYDNLGMRCSGDARVYIEVIEGRHPLWIYGAGHVGKTLCHFAALTGFFSIYLIDDREAMLADIPALDHVTTILTDRTYRQNVPAPTPGGFVVIVTRCHDVDETIIERVLQFNDWAYVGMIGSRTKINALYRNLNDRGIPPHVTAAVNAPIGIPIGGKTPSDIAVSILARLLQVRNGLEPSFRDRVMSAASSPAPHPDEPPE